MVDFLQLNQAFRAATSLQRITIAVVKTGVHLPNKSRLKNRVKCVGGNRVQKKKAGATTHRSPLDTPRTSTRGDGGVCADFHTTGDTNTGTRNTPHLAFLGLVDFLAQSRHTYHTDELWKTRLVVTRSSPQRAPCPGETCPAKAPAARRRRGGQSKSGGRPTHVG